MVLHLKRWVLLSAVLVLSACGGGGGASLYSAPSAAASAPSGAASAVATTVEVLTSANTLGSGAGETVAITAVVKDSANNGLGSTPVSFSVDSGTLTAVSATTDVAGLATAIFSTGSGKSNRVATVTVRSGSATGAVQVSIENTALAYSGATTFTLGGSSTVSVIAKDSKGASISNASITVTSLLGNGLSASTVTTDVNGQASLNYTATTAGSDTLTFRGLGASTVARLTVSGEDFRFTTPSPSASSTVPVGASSPLTVTYRQNGAPVAGRAVTFAATLGTLTSASAVTDAAGQASVAISSTFAGASVVSASLAGVTAQATVPVQFIATQPSVLVLQVSPTALAPNGAGSTANQANVVARVTDSAANPVTGVTVNFSQLQDLSGGQLSQASAVTDTNGQASVKYIAGPNSTASGGVVLRGAVASNALVSNTFPLTVNQSALFIALGTGNTILNDNEQTYRKNYTVYVTDANSVVVPGVTITVRALPQRYGKGRLIFGGTSWGIGAVGVDYINCPNEDINFNGSRDAGEDANGNGRLEPGNVISVTPGTLVTDSTGRATISLVYAESYAPWVEIRLEVQATVSGTASTTSSTFFVVGSAEDFGGETVPPAGLNSPFGRNVTSCANPG